MNKLQDTLRKQKNDSGLPLEKCSAVTEVVRYNVELPDDCS
jgi:hypothetical protein